MIYLLCSKFELSEFMFLGLQNINTILVPIKKHTPFIHRVIKAFHYKVCDKFYSNYYPSSITKQLRSITPNDCLIVFGEDSYSFYVLSHLCKDVKHKVAYFWNPCKDLNKQKVNRSLSKLVDMPGAIVEYIRSLGFKMATFDRQDSVNYNMAYFPQFYRLYNQNVSSAIEYDFFFCGRDKGRRNIIEEYKSLLSKIGTCKFLIIETNCTSDALGYFEYIKQIEKTRVICEVVQEGQTGMTIRALEALFLRKKLITNNSEISEYDFYHPNNILILDENTNSDTIENFIRRPYFEINNEIVNHYTVENLLHNLSKIDL